MLRPLPHSVSASATRTLALGQQQGRSGARSGLLQPTVLGSIEDHTAPQAQVPVSILVMGDVIMDTDNFREVVPFEGRNVLPLYRLVHWKVPVNTGRSNIHFIIIGASTVLLPCLLQSEGLSPPGHTPSISQPPHGTSPTHTFSYQDTILVQSCIYTMHVRMCMCMCAMHVGMRILLPTFSSLPCPDGFGMHFIFILV